MAKMKKNMPERFTALSNKIVRDDKLSWKARGIFLYLFSQSDDWDFYETEVVKHSIDGRDSLRSGLKELEDRGYIKRERIRNDKGQLMSSDWLLSDVPMLNEPMLEYPTLDSTTLSNTNKSNTNKSNTNNNKPPHLLNDNTSIVLPNVDIDIKEKNEVVGGYQKLVRLFEENSFGLISPIVAEKLSAELQDFTKESGSIEEATNVIKKAMEIATLNGANNISYVFAITKKWYQHNLFTLSDVETFENQQAMSKQNYSKRSQKVIEPILPSMKKENGGAW